MERCIAPEWLDDLAPEHPLAFSSRRDLQRLNAWMGNARIAARALGSLTCSKPPAHIIEVGAGDGSFLLRVVQAVNGTWEVRNATLLDRQRVVRNETRGAFERLGWRVTDVESDVFDWARQANGGADILLANLFLHHFPGAKLRELFHHLATKVNAVVAVEPRRCWPGFVLSRLVGFIGCNRVTRHDAPISVRAGFNNAELSALWPRDPRWLLTERPAGLFSHLFVAQIRG